MAAPVGRGGGGRGGPGGAGPGKGLGRQHGRAGHGAAPGPRVRQRGPALRPSVRPSLPAPRARGDLAAATRPRLYRSTAVLPLQRPVALQGLGPCMLCWFGVFFLRKVF